LKDQPIEPGRPEFSLIRGGPWYRLQLWLRLLRPDSLQVGKRAAFFALLAWAPLAALTMKSGTAYAVAGGLSFFQDIAVHVRFLVALPILIIAEAPIDRYTGVVVEHLQRSGVVGPSGRDQLDRAIRSTTGMRDSWIVAIVLIVLAFLGGWSRVTHSALQLKTWYEPSGADQALSPAGYWLGFVATPLFVSVLLRSLWRFGLWSRFLFSLSRIRLELSPAHPDRAGGLGGLQVGHQPFAAIYFVLGVMFSATIANQVLYNGAQILDFKMLAASLIVCVVVSYAMPLLAFTPKLITCKRVGILEYESLSGEYTRGFDQKWIRSGARSSEPLLGTSDIQSLADIGNAFERVDTMRTFVVPAKGLMVPVLAVGVPLLPLALMVMPLEDLVKLLLKALV
jgi:hypothetical protein